MPVSFAVLLLLGVLLYTLPAWAKLKYLDVACGSGLKPSQTSGVPGGIVHSYAFVGNCSLISMLSSGPYVNDHPPLVATARWNKLTRKYTEHLHFLTAAKITMNAGDGWTGTVEVTTNPEDATFKCNADPVIYKDTHCTLVKQHNGTGWGKQYDGFAWRPTHNQPLLLGVAAISPVRAFTKGKSISCSGLHLTDTTGVPNGKMRSYHFRGTCNLYHSQDGSGGLQATHVLANGKWDAITQQAVERVTVLAPANQGGGSWMTKYTCTDDPWLNGHAHCFETFHGGQVPSVYAPITDILKGHPLTQGKANAAQAAHFSRTHH